MSIIGSLPFTLTNGETADATQVMANFNSIIADVNGGAAENGANASITQLTGITTPIPVSEGGTGENTLTAKAVLLGNGAGGVQAVAPAGTLGNLLLDNGTTWTGTQVLSGSYSFAVNAAIPPTAGIHSPAAKTVCIATNGADQLCVGPTGGGYMQGATGADKGVGSFNAQGMFQNGQPVGQGAKVWLEYQGSTGTIIASFNVAGVVKNATGDYTISFTTPFATGAYVPIGMCFGESTIDVVALSPGSVEVNVFSSGAPADATIFIAIFGTQ
jgi:hypothetical protein